MQTNFNMEYHNITMVRGDTVAFNVVPLDQDGNVVTITSAYFSCKKNRALDTYEFQKSLSDGITQDAGGLFVRIAPEDTADMDAGRYYYDLQLGIDDDVYTVMIGTLSIEQDVTTEV